MNDSGRTVRAVALCAQAGAEVAVVAGRSTGTLGSTLDTSSLSVGRTYYQLTFADPDLTMPGVEPLVFLGHLELEDGGASFAFQDTVSYVRFGSRLQLKEDHDEITVYFLSESNVAALEDIAGIAREIAAAAERAAAANHPVLKVLREGWKSAS